MSVLRLVVVVASLFVLVALPGEAAAQDRPSRVLLIMLDQARPDTIERYDMDNVKALMRRGASFPNALVGHMAAETVISHSVLTSGLFPKHMGWSNEVYRDVDGTLGTSGAYYVTSSMSCNQFEALTAANGVKRLPDYLDEEFGEGSRFASIAQKRTAVCPAGATAGGIAADPEDFQFQIRGSSSSTACDPTYHDSGWRQPEFRSGGAPPAYFGLAFPCSRWSTWQAAAQYGTGAPLFPLPGAIYPIEGDRFVPGRDDVHVGGDNWSADAAIRVIEADDTWNGMMVSLGAIDKMGHMWGPEDDVTGPPGSDLEMTHLPFAAKNADEQVGRIVDALEAKGILDETLIVVTADHAAMNGEPFQGRLDGPQDPLSGIRCNPVNGSSGLRSDCNWYYGQDADENYRDPSPAVAALRDALTPAGGDPVSDTNLAFAYQDGHVTAWLKDNSREAKLEAAEVMLDMPGVIATYHLNADQDDYVRFGTNKTTGHERAWFVQHADDLIDTMAAPFGPDVVGLLRSNITYGTQGDHGGHNRLIQNIPMILAGPGIGRKDPNREMRLVDVMPTVLSQMGIDYDEDDFDGRAIRLPKG